MNLDAVTRILSPKQIHSIAESERAPLALWSGAVSSGKTIASLIAFLIALAKAPDEGLVVIVGRTLQTIERNIIDPLLTPKLFGLFTRHVHHTTGSTTATILGRTVHLIGASDARAEGRIRGSTICLALVDEATLLPQSFWMMLMSRLRVGDESRLLATTNPDGPRHWLRQDFLLRAAEVGLTNWHFTLDDNPSLGAGFVARLKAQYVGLWYRRFILGQWCLAAGAVFDIWDEAKHVVDILPPIARWIGLGVDYGTTNAFAATALGLGNDGVLYAAAEWRYDSRQELRQLTDGEYSERLRGWLVEKEIRPEWVAVDPSAASFLLQLHRDGVHPVGADNSVLDGIRQLSSLIVAGKLKVHRSCKGLLGEIPGYSWDEKAAEKGEDKPIKVADHSIDSLRYVTRTTEALWQGAVRLAA